jgi:protein SCO1/2
MPNMCPAVIVKNQYLAEKLSNLNIEFILISFDHIYDTPSRLKKLYYNIQSKYDNLSFISSYNSLDDLNLISRETGMSFWGINKNDIGHTMRSVLISPDGKLLSAYDGLDWDVKNVEKNIKEISSLQ